MKSGFKVLDSDIHVLEPMELWEQYLDPAYRDRAPQRPQGRGSWIEMDGRVFPAGTDSPDRKRAMHIRYQSGRFQQRLEQRPEGYEGMMGGTTPDLMLKAMEVEGVDMAVVFRTYAAHLVGIDGMDPEFAGALCRAFNRWGADFCGHAPDRLHLGAQVPLQDPEVAAREARYAVEECGAATLVLPSHQVNGRPLYRRDYDPLWATAQELGVAVSFHGIQSAYADDMLSNRYDDNHVMGHVTGHPMEMMLALGEVVAGGVASRFPGVNFAFLEGNCSWLPWYLYALDSRWEEWGDTERFEQDELPSELFRRQCYVSVDVDEHLVTQVVETIGDENLVLSTDWPHDDSEYPHAIDEFLGIEGLSDDNRRRILWDNCARLYGLDAAEV